MKEINSVICSTFYYLLLFAVPSITCFNWCYSYKLLLFSITVLMRLRLTAQSLKLYQ